MRLAAAAILLVATFAHPTHAAEGGGRLVYTSDGSIFASSVDGDLRWRLTRSETDLAPSWSPDGSQVAFLRNEDGVIDLYVVTMNGKRETRLAQNVGNTFDWSPNGRLIAFTSVGPELLQRTPHVFVVDVRSGLVEQVTEGPRADAEPVWSPTGSSLLFVGSENSVAGPATADIYKVRLDGSAAVALTSDAGVNHSPDWSPDGRRIVFASTRDGGGGAAEPAAEIYVMDAHGGSERRLTHRRSAHDIAPRWSPDGKHIAFLEYEGRSGSAHGRVRMIDASTERDRALTSMQEMMTWDPSWAPDGDAIVFVASRIGDDEERSDTEIVYLDLSNRNTRFVTDNERFEWGPDWI